MTKKDMARKLAEATQIPVSKANEILTVLFEAEEGKGIIASELDAGQKVTIPGFGTFGVRTRAERTGTSPLTREKITIPARKYVFFHPGKTLKERTERKL
ncbi:MAG: HU family DNA-binding protein [Myxococcota bacterium]|jgi:DNA-binding protein HU-beta|nr:HU family DNA-binding protein [Myxococcota bacterium]